MSFAQFELAAAEKWKPKVLVLADSNRTVVRADNIQIGVDAFVASKFDE